MIFIDDKISIDEKDIHEDFIHSSGPGGQNVNKVATAVQLRFDLRSSTSLPDDVKDRLVLIAGRRITRDGILVIKAARYRTQDLNRKDAISRLSDLIKKATEVRKSRRKTRPTFASKQRRIEAKRLHSETKTQRKFIPKADE
jgi:ribosome-associated protein